MEHPRLLVGKRIRHCFEVDKELVWYTGIVINMKKNSMEYEVKYGGKEETFWFKLLEDIINGDLELL